MSRILCACGGTLSFTIDRQYGQTLQHCTNCGVRPLPIRRVVTNRVVEALTEEECRSLTNKGRCEECRREFESTDGRTKLCGDLKCKRKRQKRYRENLSGKVA